MLGCVSLCVVYTGEFTVANVSGRLGTQCNTKVMAFLKKEGKKQQQTAATLCGKTVAGCRTRLGKQSLGGPCGSAGLTEYSS